MVIFMLKVNIQIFNFIFFIMIQILNIFNLKKMNIEASKILTSLNTCILYLTNLSIIFYFTLYSSSYIYFFA